MARKNRVVVEDGLYHVTTRIAHQAHLLESPSVKARIVDWIYGIADFSGVEVCAWNVMDNHLHLVLRVPSVPERYWLADPARGTGPSTVALSMRPRENRTQRWTPDLADRNHPITPAGDCPSEAAVVAALANGQPVAFVPRPPTGFTMSDDEMIGRLRFLYRPKTVDDIAARWASARAADRGDLVEEEKDAYCRRMYNVSQYMKTLKQRVSQFFNTECGHEGQLWDGRFYSALVDRDDALARLYVASYVELNSYRTKRRIAPKDWPWCSYATAKGDSPLAKRAREGYERLFGMPWEEAARHLEAVFAAEMPADFDAESGDLGRLSTMEQLVKVSCRMFERGVFISRDPDFATRTLASLPAKFPAGGTRSAKFFGRFRWGRTA